MNIIKSVFVCFAVLNSTIGIAQRKSKIKLTPNTNSPYFYRWETAISNKKKNISSSNDIVIYFSGIQSLAFKKNKNKSFSVTEKILDLELKKNNNIEFSLSHIFFDDYYDRAQEFNKIVKGFEHTYNLNDNGEISASKFSIPAIDSDKSTRRLEKLKKMLQSIGTDITYPYLSKKINSGTSWIEDKSVKTYNKDSVVFKVEYSVKNISKKEVLLSFESSTNLDQENKKTNIQGTIIISLKTGLPISLRSITKLQKNLTIFSNVQMIPTINEKNNFVQELLLNKIQTREDKYLKHFHYFEIDNSTTNDTVFSFYYQDKIKIFKKDQNLIKLKKGIKNTLTLESFFEKKDVLSLGCDFLPFDNYRATVTIDSLLHQSIDQNIPLLNKKYKKIHYSGNKRFSRNNTYFLWLRELYDSDTLNLYYTINFPVSKDKRVITRKDYIKKRVSKKLPFTIKKYQDTLITLQGDYSNVQFYNNNGEEIGPIKLTFKSPALERTERILSKQIDSITTNDLFLYQKSDSQPYRVVNFYFSESVKSFSLEYINGYKIISDQKTLYKYQKNNTEYVGNDMYFQNYKLNNPISGLLDYDYLTLNLPPKRNSLFTELIVNDSISHKFHPNIYYNEIKESLSLRKYIYEDETISTIKIKYPTEIVEKEISNHSDYLKKIDDRTFMVLPKMRKKNNVENPYFFRGVDSFGLELSYFLDKEKEDYLLIFKGKPEKIFIPVFNKWQEIEVSLDKKNNPK